MTHRIVVYVESFTGDYPAGLFDYEDKYYKNLSQRQQDYINNHKHYFDREGIHVQSL